MKYEANSHFKFPKRYKYLLANIIDPEKRGLIKRQLIQAELAYLNIKHRKQKESGNDKAD